MSLPQYDCVRLAAGVGYIVSLTIAALLIRHFMPPVDTSPIDFIEGIRLRFGATLDSKRGTLPAQMTPRNRLPNFSSPRGIWCYWDE